MLDPLRCRAPFNLLLQSKLGHPTTPSLGLSFSPLPSGDLVSRESQKTRKSKWKEEDFKSLGLPRLWLKIQPYRWKEHNKINLPSKFQINWTARSKDINVSIWSIFGRRSDDLTHQRMDFLFNRLIHEILPRLPQVNHQIFATSPFTSTARSSRCHLRR